LDRDLPLQSTNNSSEKKVTVIQPDPRWSFVNLSELWSYRELVSVMIIRDLKVRYKQTVMGVAWAVLQPLTMILIFTLIFGKLAKIPSDGYPYPVFVFSGLLAWNFFSSAISSSGVSLIGASNLVSKVYFPRIIVPISSIGVSLVDFVISAVLLLIMMFLYGLPITANILLLPFFLAGLFILSIGFGSWLAAITVTYRDFRYVISYLLQIWMYLTPILYPVSFVPEKWQWLLYLNPMYGWIDGIRASFLNQPIDLLGTVISLSLSIMIFAAGMFYFEKTQRRFADII
jgi:lipopolysaccharide transport system permease protein